MGSQTYVLRLGNSNLKPANPLRKYYLFLSLLFDNKNQSVLLFEHNIANFLVILIQK